MLHFIALQGVWAYKKVAHKQSRLNVIFRDGSPVLELLLQLENIHQIMQDNVETKHKHM